jgi:hypothetical protein
MKYASLGPARLTLLFLMGLCGGLLGEALLLMHAHCAKVENLLLEDFRILAFLDRKADSARAGVVEEKLLALPGVEAVRYFSPEDGLSELNARDPELVKSVALLGDNPLPGAYEVRLDAERVGGLAEWLKSAQAIPEVKDIRYKPLQARAILQVRFYHRFLTLVLSLALCLWLLGAALLLRRLAPEILSPSSASPAQWRGALWGAAPAGLGTAAGMAGIFLMAIPGDAHLLSAWPRTSSQAVLLLAGGLGGWMLSAVRPSH